MSLLGEVIRDLLPTLGVTTLFAIVIWSIVRADAVERRERTEASGTPVPSPPGPGESPSEKAPVRDLTPAPPKVSGTPDAAGAGDGSADQGR